MNEPTAPTKATKGTMLTKPNCVAFLVVLVRSMFIVCSAVGPVQSRLE